MYYPTKVLRDHGLMQKDVAEKMGVVPFVVSRIVRGNPTLESIEKMAKAINVDVVEFFTPLHANDPMLKQILNRK